jgi:uncharacterized phage protein (TIGR01671 family)
MNREIKFRAWDGEKMYYEVELTIDGWVHSWGDDGNNSDCEVIGSRSKGSILKGVEVMQFIGLKDKKKKDIYEGDIVKFNGDELGVIEWHQNENDSSYDIAYMNGNLKVICTIGTKNNVEIIGNIYENPELLTTKNI